ncbi:MAG: Dna2/Cas4 domain-containing protein [Campylobacterota bacterium]|nr:Dna2/Cas4 domain-containing protein [Campylobacterota bacterium]
MENKISKFEKFITQNLTRVLDLESKTSLGDRSTYIGASDIGGCPYKTIMSKRNPPVHSLQQQIIFQRGHLAEILVSKMLDGLNVIDQYEVMENIGEIPLKAHLDKIVKSKDRCVVVEVKTVPAPVDEPYESWVMQVMLQMGMLLEECEHNVQAYILAMDLNSGWLKTFEIEFDDSLFELCLSKKQHIEDAMLGLVEPKCIIQYYCGSCPYKMSCPKQGQFAEDLPEDIKQDLEFIKKSKLMAKESKKRENRVKSYLVNTGIAQGKDTRSDTVVTVKEQETSRFDIQAFAKDYPELHKQYLNTSSSYRMTVI